MKLKVWWIPQVPGKRFEQEVPDALTGKILLIALGRYDLFLLKNRHRPDFSNAGGMIYFDVQENDWLDWESADGNSIDDLELSDDVSTLLEPA